MTIIDEATSPDTAPPPVSSLSELDQLREKQAQLSGVVATQRIRFNLLLVFTLFLYLLPGVYMLLAFFRPDFLPQDIQYLLVSGLCYLVPIALALMVRTLYINSRNSKNVEELEKNKTRIAIIENLSPHANRTYFDNLVEINVSNLDAYYALVKVHTNNSFIASLSAGIIGFIFIIIGLLLAVTGNENSITVAVISAAAGVITNFIAAIFFYLYNQTVRELKGYHDSLINVQNILLSFKIMGDMNDGDVKIQTVATMIRFLIGNKTDSADLSSNNPPV